MSESTKFRPWMTVILLTTLIIAGIAVGSAAAQETTAEGENHTPNGDSAGVGIDNATLNTMDTEITIDTPDGEYVPGTEVNMTGSAPEDAGTVDVFVRNLDNYFFTEQIPVDAANEKYEQTGFILSDEPATAQARDIIGVPGVRQYGVIDSRDVDRIQNANPARAIRGEDGLRPSEFDASNSTRMSLEVVEPTLEGEFVTSNGQTFSVNLTGSLIGPPDYVVLFIDPLGNAKAEIFTAGNDGNITQENLDISSLSSGNVRAIVLSPGRDRFFGDGTLDFDGQIREATIPNFVVIAEELGQSSRTQAQVREFLLGQTVEQSSSDDLIINKSFCLADEMNNSCAQSFTESLPGFNNPPTNTQELNPTLYEDIDGDGDGLDPTQAVTLWTQLVINEEAFDDLTQEQIDALDWNGDGQLTPADAVSLWTEQVLN